MKRPIQSVRKYARQGFTLIELLVVIAVIGILAAILIPVIGSVRHNARVTESTSRMRQLSVAAQMYGADNQMRFPGNGNSAGQRWFHQVVPYMGVEPNGQAQGIPLYSDAYSLFDLIACPVLNGEPTGKGSSTYPARFGLNRNLMDINSGRLTGIPMTLVLDPAKTVMIATKASGTPGLHYSPYPDHPWGVAGNYERGRSPELGADSDGYIGKHAYVFCDGHLEVREYFIGEDAFWPDPNR